MKPKVINVEDAIIPSRKSPATRLLEDYGDGYQTMTSMAERYGVHVETMRRLCKARNSDGTKKVNAPSEVMQQGGLIIYLFNERDVAEIDAYMQMKGHIKEVEEID